MTAFNIGSFDGNATLAGVDDESGRSSDENPDKAIYFNALGGLDFV
jgi:hypothetical protein